MLDKLRPGFCHSRCEVEFCAKRAYMCPLGQGVCDAPVKGQASSKQAVLL